ncbi:MAG: hypothetical protein J0I48_12085 [Devosia sp.]|nr:hypothetical protein [Devosia sp.]
MNLLKMKIAQKLPLILIGSALVVGVGIGIAAYVIGLKTVDQQRAERMDASVQTGLDGVQAYLHDVSIDLSTAAARPETAVQIQQMRQAFRTTENGQQVLRDAYITNSGFGPGERLTLDEGGPTVAKYDALHKRYHASAATTISCCSARKADWSTPCRRTTISSPISARAAVTRCRKPALPE